MPHKKYKPEFLEELSDDYLKEIPLMVALATKLDSKSVANMPLIDVAHFRHKNLIAGYYKAVSKIISE